MSARFDPKAGSWLFVVDAPRTNDGKRHQVFRRGFKTEADALAAERKFLKQFGDAELSSDGTVVAELGQWLEDRELDLAPTTLSNYRNALKYIAKHLGTTKLYDLEARDVNKMYKALLKNGNRNGGPLSRETVRHVHRMLMKALGDLGVAIDGIIQPSPEEREEYGRKGVWTAAQCQQFLTYVANDRHYLAWVIIVVCGMRRGEVAGLKWPRVNLEALSLRVSWQRVVVDGGVVEKEPKGKSKRSIALGAILGLLFRDHQSRQEKEMEAAGDLYHRLGYLFCKPDGTPYHPKYFTDKFRVLCRSAGVPVITLHDGRHTSATVGADHGVPRHAMQRRLGHAHQKTTDEIYTHVLPEAERRAALIMEDAVLAGTIAEWVTAELVAA
ncbi:site-specific integrase [Dactylosporangium sp. NPDC000244]|uniref:site-specific integrase n=1 Tax=Dactylosporangium sp. NPDC000244 TaxID=3154365 RepID=UPI00331C8830